MKQLTVVKGHGIVRGQDSAFVQCTEVMTAIKPLSVGILGTFTFTSTIPSSSFTFAHLVPLLLQASSHLVPLLLQASSHLVSLLLQESSLQLLLFLLKLFYFTFVYGIGKTILRVLLLEFVIAQSPDKMKGFVFGITITTRGLVFFIYFMFIYKQLTLCCLLFVSLGLVVLFVVFLILSKRYTLRERNREINIQAIVEEHYERYMDQEEEYMREQRCLIRDRETK